LKDLSQASGLPIKLEDIGLTFDQNVFPVDPKTRTYDEAKDVYLEKGAEEQDLYHMYRYFEAEEDTTKFEAADLEYDITVVKPGKVGPEFIKTAGHYHGYVPNTNLTYPEVYEVVDGEVEYLIQTKPDAESTIDVVVVKAQKGDKVVIPPGYGHVSINPGSDYLISSNLQKRDLPATADYETYKVNNGGALYRTAEGYQKNFNYNFENQRIVKPREKAEWGLTKDKPLYTSFIESPEKFKFLTEPQNFDFSDIWTEI
jgi:glucose-6-phosphate isomerase